MADIDCGSRRIASLKSAIATVLLAFGRIYNATAIPRFGMVLIELDRTAVIIERLVQGAGDEIGTSPVGESCGKFWMNADRLAVILDGARIFRALRIDFAAIIKSECVGRIEPDCFIEIRESVGWIVLKLIDKAPVGKRHRISGIEANGLLGIGERFIELTCEGVSHRSVHIGPREALTAPLPDTMADVQAKIC